jgi:hypothetical protein
MEESVMATAHFVYVLCIIASVSFAVTGNTAQNTRHRVILQRSKLHRQSCKSMFMASLLGMLALGSTTSFAYTISCPDDSYPLNGCTLPGVVDGSQPYFDNVVSVDYNGDKLEKKGYFDIKARIINNSTAMLVNGEAVYSIKKPKFKMNVRVDEGGSYGELKLSGSIEGTKFKVSANLNPGGLHDKGSRGAWASSLDSMLWGFNTYDIKCKGLEGIVDCTENEVVFLNLLSAIGPDNPTAFNKVSTTGKAITSVPVPATVPVPAAAWLFGSGLLGLIRISRLKKVI